MLTGKAGVVETAVIAGNIQNRVGVFVCHYLYIAYIHVHYTYILYVHYYSFSFLFLSLFLWVNTDLLDPASLTPHSNKYWYWISFPNTSIEYSIEYRDS